jgi:hypothetical protein
MSEVEYESLLCAAKLSCEEAVVTARRNLEKSTASFDSVRSKPGVCMALKHHILGRSIGNTISLIFAESNLKAVTTPVKRVEWNTVFPHSNDRYGIYPYGGDTLEKATNEWLKFTALTDTEKPGEVSRDRIKDLSRALRHIELMYPKRYPIDVWVRVGELMRVVC